MSGLAAAYVLHQNDVPVTVFEAGGEPGGRVKDRVFSQSGEVAEMGAQWIGESQTALIDLLHHFGLELYESRPAARTRLNLWRLSLTFTANEAKPSHFHAEIERLAAQLDPVNPWAHPNAALWDGLSVSAWLAQHVNRIDHFLVQLELSSIISGDLSATSFLYFLLYVRRAGSLRALLTDAQQYRVRGGIQGIAQRIANCLGENLHLNEPVKHIAGYEGDVVTLTTNNGQYRFSHVIVAMSPKDALRLNFTPELPDSRQQLMNAWQMEHGMKAMLVYERPFWRGRTDEGITTLRLSNPSLIIVDNTQNSQQQGVLLIFADPKQLPTDPDRRRDAVVKAVASAMGRKTRSYMQYIEQNWGSEPYISGCISSTPPGVLTQWGQTLRPSIGRLHWAGTETAVQWMGYVDGAVRAGQDAALAILSEMDTDPAAPLWKLDYQGIDDRSVR